MSALFDKRVLFKYTQHADYNGENIKSELKKAPLLGAFL